MKQNNLNDDILPLPLFPHPPNLFCYLVKWIIIIAMQCITTDENDQTIELNNA